jgi:hypothetical protein
LSDGFYESREWLDLRYRVLQRAGGSCKLCGCRATPDNPIQVDHIKPRSLHPELELVESNLQVLCKACNMGKSNKDATDWRFKASKELSDGIARKAAILAHASPMQKAKLEQLSWLRQNDPSSQKEADKQYKALWKEIEADWLACGGSTE